VLACLALATSAEAQATETSAARADRLFREGKVALEATHYGEACPKLAESQQLDPGTGTLLALALCHEGNGETASAWREFTEVFQASQKRPDRATLAQKHLRALEPKLSKLAVSVTDVASRAAIQIRVDGVALPQSSLDTPVPIDPGDHSVEASMDGMTPWKTTVHVGKDGDAKAVVVPKLEASGPALAIAAPVALPEPNAEAEHRRRLLGWGVGGGGLALIAVGGIFGGLALSDHHAATTACPSSPCSNATGVDDNNHAKTEAWVSDFGVGLGIVGVAAGTYLLLTHAAPASATGATLRPQVGPGVAGLSLTGGW
jgi:hypothetical protein